MKHVSSKFDKLKIFNTADAGISVDKAITAAINADAGISVDKAITAPITTDAGITAGNGILPTNT